MGSRPQSLTGVLCEGGDKLFMKTPLSHENNSINVTTFGSSVLLLGQEDRNVMIFYFLHISPVKKIKVGGVWERE